VPRDLSTVLIDRHIDADACHLSHRYVPKPAPVDKATDEGHGMMGWYGFEGSDTILEKPAFSKRDLWTRMRYGYRPLTVLLRREGWHVNVKRVGRRVSAEPTVFFVL
jgi:hypothetical protein